MRLATIPWAGDTSAAVVTGDRIAPVRVLPGRDGARDVLALIDRPLGEEELSALRDHAEPLGAAPALLPPLLRPPKLLYVGKNYVEHAREGAAAEGVAFSLPGAPIWFSKVASALAGSGSDVILDERFTTALDYEGELGVVIGRGGRWIEPERAIDHVFGYTIVNDITARDRQQRHQQWLVGKSADGYSPIGPWVTTRDEVADPHALELETRVGGEVRQRGSTADMIFDIPTLIADISAGMTLEPGDVIATGTPPGVGWGKGNYLQPGDEVTVSISGLGRLANRIVAAR